MYILYIVIYYYTDFSILTAYLPQKKLPSAICTILYHVGANLRPRPKLLIQRVTRVEISAHVQTC